MKTYSTVFFWKRVSEIFGFLKAKFQCVSWSGKQRYFLVKSTQDTEYNIYFYLEVRLLSYFFLKSVPKVLAKSQIPVGIINSNNKDKLWRFLINILESLWHLMKNQSELFFPEKVYQRILAFNNSNGYHDQGKQNKNIVKAAQDTE